MDKPTRKFHSRYSERTKKEYNRLSIPYIHLSKTQHGYYAIHLNLAVADWDRDGYYELSHWGLEFLRSLCKENNLYQYDVGGCSPEINHIPSDIVESLAEHLYDVFEEFLSSYKPVTGSRAGYDFTKWYGVYKRPV